MRVWPARLTWASLSKPHTSKYNGRIFIDILYICRTSFRKCKLTLLILKRTLPYSSPEPYLTGLEFYLHRFRLQVFLPMDTQGSSRRVLKPAQEQQVTEDWRQPRNETERLYCVLQRLRNKARKQREVVLGTLFKLSVK